MNAIDILPVLLLAIVLYRCNASELLSSTLHSNYLSPVATKSLRGIFSLVVVYHHAYQMAGYGILYPIFTRIGYMPVGFFFFLSGYGLMKRSLTDKSYHKSFLLKRIPTLLIPYALANFVYWLFYYLRGTNYSVTDFISRIVIGDPIVANSWYIITILLCYTFFWLSISGVRKSPLVTVVINALFCIIYIAAFIKLEFSPHWFKTIATFPVGLLWAAFEERILRIIPKPYFLLLALTASLFGLSMIFQMRYANMTAPPIRQAFFCNTTIILFVLCMLLVILKLKIGNGILEYFGEHSLELYMYHGLFLNWASPLLSRPNGAFFYTLTVLFCSTVIAHITHIVNQWLLRNWKKLLQVH